MPDPMPRLTDDVLIRELPAGLVAAVEHAIDHGGTVTGCVEVAKSCGSPLVILAVEALAERLVARREAGRN